MRHRMFVLLGLLLLVATTATSYALEARQYRLQNRPHVNVRWERGTLPEQRARVEADHGLTNSAAREQRTWVYELLDDSPANLAGLVRAAGVEDTHGFDRATFELTEPVVVPTMRLLKRAVARAIATVGLLLALVFVGVRVRRNRTLFSGRSARLMRATLVAGSQSYAFVKREVDFARFVVLFISAGLVGSMTAYGLARRTQPPGRVAVQWRSSVEPDQLLLREERYTLRSIKPIDEGFIEYDLIDTSADNIRALVQDPAVAATKDIDRAAFRVRGQRRRSPWASGGLLWAASLALAVVASLERRIIVSRRSLESAVGVIVVGGLLLAGGGAVLAGLQGRDSPSLAQAAYEGEFLEVWRLLVSGADVEEAGTVDPPPVPGAVTPLTPLEAAALSGEPAMIDLLLQEGATRPAADAAARLYCMTRLFGYEGRGMAAHLLRIGLVAAVLPTECTRESLGID